MAGLISGPAADWLQLRREDLNRRFVRAKKRHPSIDIEMVYRHLAEIMPQLAGPEPASDLLLSTVFDLILLHTGRGVMSSNRGIIFLMTEVFAELRPLLLKYPSTMPAALSNAVENMGAKGVEYADQLRLMGAGIDTPQMLLDAGVVRSWTMGEARLRKAALRISENLSANILLFAFGLNGWPDEAAPLALQLLKLDAWRNPRDLISEKQLKQFAGISTAQANKLTEKIIAEVGTADNGWKLTASIGNFAGFGGDFISPPLLLDGGDRHRFFVVSGNAHYRIDADVFGWVCRPCPPLDLPKNEIAQKSPVKIKGGKVKESPELELTGEGRLTISGQTESLEFFAGATTFVHHPALIAATVTNSYRIRIATGPVSQ